MSSGPVVVAVLSHRDPPLVRRLVERVLHSTGSVALVHHDPRGPRLDLPHSDRVLLVPDPQPCNWGQPSLAHGMLRCAAVAAGLVPDLSWFLLVSGQDYPARSMRSIERDLHASTDDGYLRWLPVPADPAQDVHHWQAVCRRRYLHKLRLPRTHRSVPAPRRHPFRGGTQLFIGDMWVNLGAAAVAHLLEQRARLRRVERYLDRCSIADEALLPTLLLNDAAHLRIVDARRRYLRWTPGDRHPAVLDAADFPAIRDSGDFFARKIDPVGSAELLDLLDGQA
ncbi:MAG TPA: beta-1,6-N-acetylglucosaminyltransferase [Mycobacteriales bacterium]|jgi:hypothetical protein|nr:beta-1,6-N-acetylglucosaminyltransferase [Mycobacteriales bacterium]